MKALMTDLQNIRLTRESNATAHKSGDIWFPTVFGHPRSESLAWQAFEFKERSVVSSVIGCYNRKVRGPLQGCRRTGFNFPLGSSWRRARPLCKRLHQQMAQGPLRSSVRDAMTEHDWFMLISLWTTTHTESHECQNNRGS